MQQLLHFGDEPLCHHSLIVPKFQRPDAPVGQYDGISPRQAFLLASELLAEGMSEAEIAPHLVKYILRQNRTIRHLLKQIEQGISTIDADQQENAYKVHALLEELTALETAWQLHELNISPLREQERMPSQDCLYLIREFRRKMGRFRGEMPKVYNQLHRET